MNSQSATGVPAVVGILGTSGRAELFSDALAFGREWQLDEHMTRLWRLRRRR